MRLTLKNFAAVSLFILAALISNAQSNSVSIGSSTTNSSAVLWLNSPNGNQGFIIPVGNRNSVSTPAKGMLIFDTNQVYYHDGTAWNPIAGGSASKTYTIKVNANYQLVLDDGTTTQNLDLPIAGDVNSTSLKNTIVTGIQGKAVTLPSATAGVQYLSYDPSQGKWIFQSPNTVNTPTLANGQILTGNGTANSATTLAGDATLNGGNVTVTGIQGKAISATAAASGNFLKFNGTNWVPSSITNADLPALTSGNILIGNSSNVASSVTVSGDATLSNSGVLTLAPNINYTSTFTAKTLGVGTGGLSLTGPLLSGASAGTAGQVLTSAGAGAAPVWSSVGGVTSITGGTGLTGGTITNTGTLAVDVGTTANKIVQLDANAKLPAVDGSALTNLNASNISSGTLSLSRLSAGTNGQVLTMVSGSPAWAAASTLTLTTTGTSGAATLTGNTLNIPNYASSYSAGTGLTLTGSTFSVNPSQSIATLSNLTSNGLIKTSGGTGALSIATAGTDYIATESDPIVKAISGIVKSNGTAISAAVAGTDYQAPLVSGTNIKTINGTSVLGSGNITAVTTEADPVVKAISGIVKSNGTTISAAVAGTDYVATESDPSVKAINGLVKSNGTTISAAVAGTDYVATESDPTVKAINGLVKSNGTTISAATAGTDYLPITGGTGVTTLGTITTGTWNGAPISETYGGTNQTTYAAGDILYASAANVLSKLGIGTSGQVLTVTGGVPVWAAAPSPFSTANYLPKGNGTSLVSSSIYDDGAGHVGIGTTTGGSGLTISGSTTYGSALGITNTGGGQDWRISSDTDGSLKFIKASGTTFPALTLTSNGALGIYDGVGSVTFGTAGQVLTSGGPGAVPTWSTITGTGTVTNVTGTAPISVATGTTTPVISITQANATTNGYLSSTDWSAFNSKQGAITLTTTGTSGAATLVGSTLNIPNYAGTSYTAGTGLTLAANTFSVNTSQNITTLSNLTSNGLIKTSGGTGALSIATAGTDYVATESDPTVKAISGIVKSNGTTISAAVAGTDYVATETDPTVKAINGLVKSNGTTISAATAGTDYLAPNGNGSALTNLNASNITTGTVAIANGGTGATTAPLARTALGLGTLATLSSVTTTEILDGTIADIDVSATANINGAKINPTFGAQNVSTTGTLTTGSAGQFVVDVSGNITKINNITTSFPSTQGAANTVLTNDGAGNLSWAASSGWGLTGNAGTTAGTNFIGTTDAQDLVFKRNNLETARLDNNHWFNLYNPFGNGPLFRLDATKYGTGGRIYNIGSTTTTDTPGAGLFVIQDAIAGYRLAINSTGNVGIGTTTPNATLHVKGNAAVGSTLSPRSTKGLTVGYTTNQAFTANTDPMDSLRGLTIVNESAIANSRSILTMRSNPALNTNDQRLDFQLVNPMDGTSKLIYSFGTATNTSTDRFTFTNAGNLGIGTITPAANLDIVGNIKIADGTQGAGKVLTSDANGLASWQAVSGSGTVTNVTGTAPISVATGTSTPVISMTQANGTTNGYLSSADWTTFNSKGTGTVTNVTGTAPISVATGTTTPSITISQANSTTNGYLSSADWNTFNGKQGAITLTTTGTSGAATLVGNTLNIPNYAGTAYTAGTGLTLAANTFSVNTSQNITTLSNLTSNGLIKTSGGTGALSIATAGTDYVATETDPTVKAISGIVKSNGTTISAAVAGTDYVATETDPTVKAINGLVKSNGTAISAAVAGTDYAPATSGTSLLKGNGTGGFANAVAGTDYLNANQTITLSGDVSGSGTTAITTAIGAGKVTNTMLAGSIAASKLVGTDINTVGTITTGTWNGTKVSETFGGTNQTTYAIGDILYASASNTLSKLTVGTAGQVLTVASGVPTWAASSGWGLTGNAGTTSANFIGTTDTQPIRFKANGLASGLIDINTTWNVAFGYQSNPNNTGTNNTIIGGLALNANTTGTYNTVVGTGALSANTTGGGNVAIGPDVLVTNTTGSNNTAIGYLADVNSSGLTNATAIGANSKATANNTIQLGDGLVTTVNVGTGTTAKLVAGGLQVTGGAGTAGQVLTSDASGNATWQAAGAGSGWALTGNGSIVDGTNFIGTTNAVPFNIRVNNLSSGRIDPTLLNTFFGYQAGNTTTTGGNNVGLGYLALTANISGVDNVSIGYGSMKSNRDGVGNVAVGRGSLFNLHSTGITGGYNVAVGYQALYQTESTASSNGVHNVGLGFNAGQGNQNGTNNTFLGDAADATNLSSLTNATAIGSNAFVTASNSMVLGSINGVNGATSSTNVGIGTTSPGAPLEVRNDALAVYTSPLFRLRNDNVSGQAPIEFQVNGALRGRIRADYGGNMTYVSSGGDHYFFTGGDFGTGTERMRILGSTGYVGIGTGAPSYPLDIQTFAAGTPGSGWTIYQTGGGTTGSGSYNISLRTSNYILSPGTIANSDIRIKENMKLSDASNDLQTLLKLKVTDYDHIDKVNGNGKQKGFIAQEVKEIYPEAVKIVGKNVVPSIYSNTTSLTRTGDSTYTLNISKNHELAVGDKVKLITRSGEQVKKVIAINGPKSFSVQSNKLTSADTVFVYGKEIHDMHTVDYNRIYTLGISATQELNRKLEVEIARNLEQQKTIDDQKKMIDSLKNSENESKKKIAALEASMNKAASSETELKNLRSEIEKIKQALGLETTAKKE